MLSLCDLIISNSQWIDFIKKHRWLSISKRQLSCYFKSRDAAESPKMRLAFLYQKSPESSKQKPQSFTTSSIS